MELNKIICGDALEVLKIFPSESIDCCITSPPYWALRDYNMKAQLGLEKTFQEYVKKLLIIFDEIKRVLKKDGTCWINMGDTYTSHSIGKGNVGGMEGERMKNDEEYKKSIEAMALKKQITRFGKDGKITKEYSGRGRGSTLPDKCLCQIPSRFAIEMVNREWILRNEIIWHKNNVMPSSVKDRFTVDFEKIFFFVMQRKYYFKQQLEPLASSTDIAYRKALRREKQYNTKEPYLQNTPYAKKIKKDRGVGETYIPPTGKDHNLMNNPNGKNKRTVWSINTKPFAEAHFATFPKKLIEPMVLAGCPEGGIVLDPFMGSGTTAIVAKTLKRNYLGIELNPEYIKIAENRLLKECPPTLF